jgi:hypothetical protein
LWVHYLDPHEPYEKKPGFDLGRSDADRYDSEVAFTDHHIGRLLAAVGRLRRAAIVVVTADHGEEFGDHGGHYHGHSLYDEQVRVPLVIAAPGIEPSVSSTPVELIDLAPTLARLVGIDPPPTLRGQDLRELLVGAELPERAVFSEVDTKRMVVRGRWKLIHDWRRETDEVYDLEADAAELRNRVDEAPQRLREDLRSALAAWTDRLAGGAGARPPLTRGKLGDRGAAAALAALLADRGAQAAERAEAARLLGRLDVRQAGQAVEALAAALSDPAPSVAAEAAIALGEMKDARAHGTLLGLLSWLDTSVRRRAAVSLAELGDLASVPALLEALDDEDQELRRRAFHVLGFVGGTSAVDPLCDRAQDIRVRYVAVQALGNLGARLRDPRIKPRLAAMLAREDYADTRAYLRRALDLVGDAK